MALSCPHAAIICVGIIPWKNDQRASAVTTSATRVFYLSAEEVHWTYVPGGEDLVHGPLLGSYVNFSADPKDLRGTFIKAQYKRYTDSAFTVREYV